MQKKYYLTVINKKILSHCNKYKINIFSHKNNWKKVNKLMQMPKHSTEGLIIISNNKNYFRFLLRE